MRTFQGLRAISFLNKQAADDFLSKQSEQVRDAIKQFQRIAITAKVIALLFICWFAFTDQLASISRSIFTQVGDGTVYFLTTDPLWMGFLVYFFLIFVLGYLDELMLSFTSVYKTYISEYRNILAGIDKVDESRYRALWKVLIFVIFLLIVMCTCNYTKITDKGMYFRRIWGGSEKYYSWDRIDTVDSGYKLVRSRREHSPHYEFYAEITFVDGETWTPFTITPWQNAKVEDAVFYIRQKKSESAALELHTGNSLH